MTRNLSGIWWERVREVWPKPSNPGRNREPRSIRPDIDWRGHTHEVLICIAEMEFEASAGLDGVASGEILCEYAERVLASQDEIIMLLLKTREAAERIGLDCKDAKFYSAVIGALDGYVRRYHQADSPPLP